MFRKIVSNLPFSPGLVGQIGFYARRLRREQFTRKLGLVFTVLALVVQSFAIFSPPEPANAASSSDFVRGGVRTLNEMLAAYDSSDLKDVFTYAGITREEIANAQNGSINSKGVLSWGRTPQFSSGQGEVKHVVPQGDGGTTTVYSRPLALWDTTAYTRANGSTYDAFIGHSAQAGWFAILKNCANLVTREVPEPVPAGAIGADCDLIRGYAYDGRRLDMKVQVTLYAGGPPGSGEKIGTITANQAEPNAPAPGGSGHGFSIAVPEQYKQSETTTPVYGVMTPLPGWTSSTVDIGTASIPPNCNPQPVAECEQLTLQRIDRTTVSLDASAITENEATIEGYNFTVRSNAGDVAAERSVDSTENSANSGNIELPPGDYTASVTVLTSEGEKTGSNCEIPVNVAPPDKCPLNPELDVNDPRCQPCPGDETLWVEDERCTEQVVQGKEATNLTRDQADATSVTAQANNRIEYSLYVENIGLVPAETNIEEHLGDVLEYATLLDNGGGSFDEESQTLRWENITLQPGERQIRKFVVRLAEAIPATPQGVSDLTSYDCIMTNTFGNTVEVNVDCPLPKGVEQTVTELPKTGPGENLIFAGVVLAVAAFFFARSRLMNKEVRLVRKEYNTGTI